MADRKLVARTPPDRGDPMELFSRTSPPITPSDGASFATIAPG